MINLEQPFPVETAVPAPERAPLGAAGAWLWRRRWFALFVILPTLLATLYYGLIASDIYVSESRFVIKSPDEKRAQMNSIADIIQTTGLSSGQEQANEVLEYVRSRAALQAIEPRVRAAYSAPRGDILERFPGLIDDDSFENLFKYYGKMVVAQLDNETGTAVVTVKAFAPRDAQAIDERLLELSEALVNRLNARAQTHGIAEAQRQVDLATTRARVARVALAGYRNAQAVIDPDKQAAGVLDIANTMIAQRAALQAQLDQMQRVTPANPSLPALRQRVAAISAQIAAQDSRVTGGRGGIASKMGGYENLLVEQEFATDSLTASNAALVQARAEAVRQQFYLERVVDPNLPDDALLPERVVSVLTVVAVALCLYFVGWMLIVGIREHSPQD